ncbi:MAG: PaaX family transcriptional regulator C-terminal domain-containing protein [Acidimicrobiales bacterium]
MTSRAWGKTARLGHTGDIPDSADPRPDPKEVLDDESLGIRPLTARSVIASMLLGSNPPVLPTRVLVASAELFGVSESAARTAISRMAAAGELEVADARYRLIGPLLDRQRSQDRGRRGDRRAWDGGWVLAIIPAGRRAASDRARQRAALLRVRMGEVRDGVWARPDNLGELALPDELIRGRYAPEGPIDPADLWDLRRWSREAEALIERLTGLTSGLEAGGTDTLARGFMVAAAGLRLYRRDPLLPDELLPTGWPGERLRVAYDQFDTAYREVLRGWFRSVAPGPTGTGIADGTFGPALSLDA